MPINTKEVCISCFLFKLKSQIGYITLNAKKSMATENMDAENLYGEFYKVIKAYQQF